MRNFMLNRKILVPLGYKERSCVLVSYQLPFLPYCYVLCHESKNSLADYSSIDLAAFFLLEAERLAKEAVGDPQAFMLIHSGTSARKRANWHLHVFVVQSRMQKAWVYTVLAIKNFATASYYAFGRPLKYSGRKSTNKNRT